MENEVFEKIIRSFVIEEGKKKKDIKKLKEENAKTKQMVDGMKDRCEEKLKKKWNWARKCKNNSRWGRGSHSNGKERGTQQRNRTGKTKIELKY